MMCGAMPSGASEMMAFLVECHPEAGAILSSREEDRSP